MTAFSLKFVHSGSKIKMLAWSYRHVDFSWKFVVLKHHTVGFSVFFGLSFHRDSLANDRKDIQEEGKADFSELYPKDMGGWYPAKLFLALLLPCHPDLICLRSTVAPHQLVAKRWGPEFHIAYISHGPMGLDFTPFPHFSCSQQFDLGREMLVQHEYAAKIAWIWNSVLLCS